MLPDQLVENNYKLEIQWNRPMELDIFIPNLSLALEYNGEYHYKATIHFGLNVRRRDEKKLSICRERGITLLVIPYWWNTSLESIAETIRKERPDILLNVGRGEEISKEMPETKPTGVYVPNYAIAT